MEGNCNTSLLDKVKQTLLRRWMGKCTCYKVKLGNKPAEVEVDDDARSADWVVVVAVQW